MRIDRGDHHKDHDDYRDDGFICHSKLIFPVDSSWVVVGSHNFTADCWAFAKQMLPRNFELSVFVPLKQNEGEEGKTVFELFPLQTNFSLSDENYEKGEKHINLFILRQWKDFLRRAGIKQPLLM